MLYTDQVDNSFSLLQSPIAWVGFGFIGLLVIWVIFEIIKNKFFYQQMLHRSLDLVFLHVLVPKDVGKEEQESKRQVKEIVAKASQMFTSLSAIADEGKKSLFYGREFISFEIVSWQNKIDFYVVVPKYLQELVEKQITSIYPDASLEESEAYNFFTPNAKTAVVNLKTKRSYIYPVKLYKELEVDSVNVVTNSLSKLAEDEGAAVQILIRPAHPHWTRRSMEVIGAIEQGKELPPETWGGRFFAGFFGFLGELVRTAASGPAKEKELDSSKPRKGAVNEEMIKAMKEKTNFMGFEAMIRIVTSASNIGTANTRLSNIASSFFQFNSPSLNSFQKVSIGAPTQAIREFIFRIFPPNAPRVILNSEELATIYHFPNKNIDTPNIRWLLSRLAVAPSNVPSSGLHLGYNIYRGVKTPIYILPDDRRRHMYIIGQTGSGKTTLLLHMAKQDVKNGAGLCFLDPHGDAADELLTSIPPERADDVVWFDPAEMERPMGLNLFEYKNPEEMTFYVDEMINIFDILFDLSKTGGPIFEQYFRNAAMLIMEDPESGSTLLELPRVLADPNFRAYKLSRCKNYVVKNFWVKEAEKAGGEMSLANVVPYVTSKIAPFVANDFLRPIIAQQKSTIDFRDAMDTSKIFIGKLSKGRIGEKNMSLLGLVIVGRLLSAALSRTDMPKEQRRDFFLYMDEFQNFSTRSISTILSEARKYGLAMILAHQFVKQLDEKIKDSVLGNAGSIISFRISPEDTEIMGKAFAGAFSDNDFINLEFANAYIAMLISGTRGKGFSLNTYRELGKEKKDFALGEKIKKLSALKYGRPREIVEEEIEERTKF